MLYILCRDEQRRIATLVDTFQVKKDHKAGICNWFNDAVLVVSTSIDDIPNLDQDVPKGYPGEGYAWDHILETGHN